jgi:hypothetical protein
MLGRLGLLDPGMTDESDFASIKVHKMLAGKFSGRTDEFPIDVFELGGMDVGEGLTKLSSPWEPSGPRLLAY